MSKAEMLARIQEGARNQNNPELSPEVVKQIQQQLATQAAQGWNLPVGPSKVDPERDANDQINRATPQTNPGPLNGKPQGPQIPDSLAPGQAMPDMLDNPSDEDQAKMNKLMWLQQKAQNGQ